MEKEAERLLVAEGAMKRAMLEHQQKNRAEAVGAENQPWRSLHCPFPSSIYRGTRRGVAYPALKSLQEVSKEIKVIYLKPVG